MLVDRFPETVDMQPELVAYHYAEAGLAEQALPYWQAAGQRAMQQSAHTEAIQHLTTALEVLSRLPPAPEHLQLELVLQTMLGVPLMTTKGWAAPEAKQTFSRAYELSQQLEETPELFPVLYGLVTYYGTRAEYQTAQPLAQQCLRLAQRAQDGSLLLMAEYANCTTLHTGDFVRAQELSEHVVQQYDPLQHGALGFRFGIDPGVVCGIYAACSAWYLGYPDHAFKRAQDTLALAQNVSHSGSRTGAVLLALVYLSRGEATLAQELAERSLAEETEKGLIFNAQFAKILGALPWRNRGGQTRAWPCGRRAGTLYKPWIAAFAIACFCS